MALQLPPTPNFNLQTPDVTGGMLRAATLSQLLSENSVRKQLAPLEVQEQQAKTAQAGIQTQEQQMELDSRKAMMAAIASGDLNKYAGVDTQDGSGFDAGGAYQYLISKGVRPQEASEYANSWLAIGAKEAETAKNLSESSKANQEIREKTLKQVASKLGSIGDMSVGKATAALDAFKQSLVNNPKAYPGLTQDELGHLYGTDLMHLDALEAHLGLVAMVADYHRQNQEAINATPEGAAAKAAAEAKAKLGIESSPEAIALAGKKAGAEAKGRFPYELALKQEEVGQNPAFAFNPQTGQRELTTIGEAKKNGQSFAKVTQADIEKETSLNSQMNDMQLNTSRYRAALNAMGPLSTADRNAMTRILSDASLNGFLTNGATLGAMMDQISQGEKGKAWNSLSADKQDALIGFLRMKNTGLLAQKVLTGMGRASKEALDIELSNMPSPIEGATVGNKKLDAWQDNLDQINARSVKLPWMESPLDVRKRVEGQAVTNYNAKQTAKEAAGGQFKPAGKTPGVGQWVTVTMRGNAQAMKKVSKVYPNGTFDVE